MNIATIPAELRARVQWAPYFIGRGGNKIPMDLHTGHGASHSAPATWSDFGTAARAVTSGRYAGLDFASGGGVVVVDLDHCVAVKGTLSLFADTIVNELNSYTEYSPSHAGLHIFCLGTKPGPRCRYQADGTELEMYDGAHFMSVTGDHVPGTPIAVGERSDVLSRLYTRLWPARPAEAATRAPVTPRSDTDVLRIACKSATFAALWQGDLSRYANNESRADYAFCCSLAGLTRDPAQIERLWWNSGLARLPQRAQKWASRRGPGTYGTVTINAALLAIAPRIEVSQ